MTAHKKHEALDATVHFLLALTMWACTLCTLSELLARHSVLPTAGRALSCMMQGMWLIQVFCCQVFHAVNASWCRLLMASSLFCNLGDMVGIKRGCLMSCTTFVYLWKHLHDAGHVVQSTSLPGS